jgi:hypothetical protein
MRSSVDTALEIYHLLTTAERNNRSEAGAEIDLEERDRASRDQPWEGGRRASPVLRCFLNDRIGVIASAEPTSRRTICRPRLRKIVDRSSGPSRRHNRRAWQIGSPALAASPETSNDRNAMPSSGMNALNLTCLQQPTHSKAVSRPAQLAK